MPPKTRLNLGQRFDLIKQLDEKVNSSTAETVICTQNSALFLQKTTRKVAARDFGVSQSAITRIVAGSFEFFADFDAAVEVCDEEPCDEVNPDEIGDDVIERYFNPEQNGSQDVKGFGLNESIVSISSNGEIILQLLRIEKHAAKTGEAEAGQLIAQARRIFEQREL